MCNTLITITFVLNINFIFIYNFLLEKYGKDLLLLLYFFEKNV